MLARYANIDAFVSQVSWTANQQFHLRKINVAFKVVDAVRDRTAFELRMDGVPLMSNITADWRNCKPYNATCQGPLNRR